MLVSVESTNNFDSTLAVGCSAEQLLYQVLHRTAANEPLRIIPPRQGQKGFVAWHAIVRRYDQRNMSGKNSAHAARISNISERDRAKYVTLSLGGSSTRQTSLRTCSARSEMRKYDRSQKADA